MSQNTSKALFLAAILLLSGCGYDYCAEPVYRREFDSIKQCLRTQNCMVDAEDLRQVDYYEHRCMRVEQ